VWDRSVLNDPVANFEMPPYIQVKNADFQPETIPAKTGKKGNKGESLQRAQAQQLAQFT
jgi:hypothetical protein